MVKKQTNADLAIAKLTEEQKATLNRLLLEHANAAEVHRWLVSVQPGVSYGSVLTWYQRNQELSDKAKLINSTIVECRGINALDAHAMSLAAVIALSDRLGEIVKRANDEDIVKLAGTMVDVLREQRQCAQALAAAQRLGDLRSLELAGGYRVAELAVNLSRDTPNAEAVKTAIEGALSKLESEV